jgi:thioredoxin-like negative regulator of GroEL
LYRDAEEAVEKQKADLPTSIEAARGFMGEFDYDRGLEVCLALLRKDYDNQEAHELLLDTFHTLGFKNELVLRVREELRTILLEGSSDAAR